MCWNTPQARTTDLDPDDLTSEYLWTVEDLQQVFFDDLDIDDLGHRFDALMDARVLLPPLGPATASPQLARVVETALPPPSPSTSLQELFSTGGLVGRVRPIDGQLQLTAAAFCFITEDKAYCPAYWASADEPVDVAADLFAFARELANTPPHP